MVRRTSIPGLSSVAALVVALCGCATTDPAGSPRAAAAKAATAVPSNYRQLIARKIAAHTDLSTLRKAEISEPGEGWMGLINGGNRPIACVALTIQGPLIQQTNVLGYTFKNGQIDDVFYPNAVNPAIGAVATAIGGQMTCGKLAYSPFPELTKRT